MTFPGFTFFDPGSLVEGDLRLELVRTYSHRISEEYVPAYGFEMVVDGLGRVGSIRFRVASSSLLESYYGHFGYEVELPHRGRNLAERSCRLLFPLARRHGLHTLWITCNPGNTASRRTCERLGATLVEIVPVPSETELYAKGDRAKCRYRIDVPDSADSPR